MAGFSAQGLTRLKSRVSRAGFLYGGSGEESASKLIQVVGSISVPRWLSAGGLSLSSVRLLEFLLVCSPPSSNQQSRPSYASDLSAFLFF